MKFSSLHLSITILVSFFTSLAARLLSEFFLHDRIAIAGSFLGLVPVQNAGVAFGLHLPPVIQELLIACVLILFVVVAMRQRHQVLPSIGFGLILGGALANILDRFDDGTVTDFFQVGSFPVFNVADSWITIGAVLLLLTEFLQHSFKAKDTSQNG